MRKRSKRYKKLFDLVRNKKPDSVGKTIDAVKANSIIIGFSANNGKDWLSIINR